MYNFVLGNVTQMRREAESLFRDHWDEIALNKGVMALKPDYDRYEAIERAGNLMVICVYDDTKLVGYSVNMIIHHLHYADLVVSSNDLLFVHKDYRKGRLGLMLIRETEEQSRQRGAQLVLWHAKPNTALNELMPRLGYGVQDIIYSKEV